MGRANDVPFEVNDRLPFGFWTSPGWVCKLWLDETLQSATGNGGVLFVRFYAEDRQYPPCPVGLNRSHLEWQKNGWSCSSAGAGKKTLCR